MWGELQWAEAVFWAGREEIQGDRGSLNKGMILGGGGM